MRLSRTEEWEFQVEDIAYNIGHYCRTWGRINVTQTKEKYGTCRVYCSFGWLSLHSLTHPGYVYSQYSDWLWKLDCRVISPVLRLLVQPWFIRYQFWIYKKAYRKFTKHLSTEQRKDIYRFADHNELIE